MDRLVDEGTFVEAGDDLSSSDPLEFPGYADALAAARERSGTDESVRAGSAAIGGRAVELAAFQFGFIGGSMGEVAGERLARALERAADRRVPFVLYTATGGARMQEGMRSLIQMAKVIVARGALTDAGQPLIAVFGNPTTGGVLASIGALADITVVEDGATIGFAGPRLVQQFTGRPLGPGSHTASGAFQHGLVDHVLPPAEIRDFLGGVLELLAPDEPAAIESPSQTPVGHIDAWDAVTAARASDRPRGPELVRAVTDRYVTLHGDRAGGEDPGVFAALVRVAGRRALMIALDREHAPGPAAYRKARRCVAIAERLGLSIVTLVDTPGANPSEGSEARGVAWEIGRLFEAILNARCPVLSVVTGEGGSGGALALAVGDRLLSYEDAIFSVIAPESAAEILWRNGERAPDAARDLRVTAGDLKRLGVADEVIPAPLTPDSLRRALAYHLGRLDGAGPTARKRRWRGHGD
ncbi:MAG: carboxyl transferase domain-containing protein [Actinomycetota bacterium]